MEGFERLLKGALPTATTMDMQIPRGVLYRLGRSDICALPLGSDSDANHGTSSRLLRCCGRLMSPWNGMQKRWKGGIQIMNPDMRGVCGLKVESSGLTDALGTINRCSSKDKPTIRIQSERTSSQLKARLWSARSSLTAACCRMVNVAQGDTELFKLRYK